MSTEQVSGQPRLFSKTLSQYTNKEGWGNACYEGLSAECGLPAATYKARGVGMHSNPRADKAETGDPRGSKAMPPGGVEISRLSERP